MSKFKDIVPAPFLFSQSSLQDYTDCPRRFELRYIDQIQWPAIETAPVLENERRQIEGQIFHRMVQQYFIELPVEKITPFASSENLIRWWENFLAQRLDFPEYKIFTELSLSTPIGRHRLIAKFDLLAVKVGEHAVIYDWKTYRSKPKRNWILDRLQTKAYLSLILRTGQSVNNGASINPDQAEMVYWFSDYPDKPEVIKFDHFQFEQTWNNLENLVGEIDARQSFPMTENEKQCSYCVYRSYCERGISAGEEDNIDAIDQTIDIDFDQIQEIEF